MYVRVCNRFHDRQANSGKITTFREYPFLTPACADLLKRKVGTYTAKIYIQWRKFHTQVVWSISSHFGAFHF